MATLTLRVDRIGQPSGWKHQWTLDGVPVARLLNNAPVVRSIGRSYAVTTRHVGTTAAGDRRPRSVPDQVAAHGVVATGYDFGERPAVISGTVWNDVNRNARLDTSEPRRFGDVLIVVRDSDGNTVASGPTNSDGTYRFEVPIGTYTVSEATQPVGHESTTPDEFTVDVPAAGRHNVDFGEAQPTGRIGDRVWHDKNRDGRQDSDESPIAGVVVTINRPDGTTSTATTGPNGLYLFDNLPVGVYQVTLTTVPAGVWLLTTPGLVTIDLQPAQDYLEADFGLFDAAINGQKELPTTGADVSTVLNLGAAALFTGLILVMMARRRQSADPID